MTAKRLIDLIIEEIARDYQPGTSPRMKMNRQGAWGKMLALEEEINKTALCGNLDAFRGVLNSYRGVILAMVEEFKSLKKKKGQGMFDFADRPPVKGG